MNGEKWFEIEQIETAVDANGSMTAEEILKCRKKLIVMHQCGKNKTALIKQLKTMIFGLESDFESFSN
jgi:hypothetical protein